MESLINPLAAHHPATGGFFVLQEPYYPVPQHHILKKGTCVEESVMGKAKGFIIIVLLACAAVLTYKIDMDLRKMQNRGAVNQNVDEKAYEEAQSKIDESAIIKKALKAVGILAVLEGEEEYKQVIEEETWYSYRGINIDWRYKFAIAMNLEDIGINVSNGTVDVTIDTEKLFIQYIEKTEDSTSRSDASFLAKKYNSQEIEAIEKAILEKIDEKIKSTQNYWDEAVKSLEVNIRKICNDLSYYDINFIRQENPDDQIPLG